MDNGKPTTLVELLPLLRAAVAAGTGINQEYVIPTLDESFFEPGGEAEKYVLLGADMTGQAIDGWYTGGGNQALAWMVEMDLALVARLDVDKAGRDLQRLVEANKGLLAEWRELLKSVSQWNPTSSGQGLLIQPARTTQFKIGRRRARSSIGWVQIRTRLSFGFLQDMS